MQRFASGLDVGPFSPSISSDGNAQNIRFCHVDTDGLNLAIGEVEIEGTSAFAPTGSGTTRGPTVTSKAIELVPLAEFVVGGLFLGSVLYRTCRIKGPSMSVVLSSKPTGRYGNPKRETNVFTPSLVSSC